MAVARVASVNVGRMRDIGARGGPTGIDKCPVDGAVRIDDPSPGTSGLDGDAIGDTTHHGGRYQAVYALERDELDWWQRQLGRPLPNGSFGENLTVEGVDTAAAVIGERWRIGEVVLQVTVPRIPCSTFAVWIEAKGFLKAFTRRGRPGTYLRVLSPGEVGAGDPIVVGPVPDHGVTVSTTYRAMTLEPALLPGLLTAGDHLPPDVRDLALTRTALTLDEG